MPLLAQKLTADIPFDILSGILRYDAASRSEAITRLWFGIYPGKVTLLNGETGAGKSTLLRLIAIHAALGKPLFDTPFSPDRSLRVLYIDPENMGNAANRDGGLTVHRLDALELGRTPNLLLHSGFNNAGDPLDLSNRKHRDDLKRYILDNRIDLVIIDTYAALFHVKNENDNAEATQHGMSIKRLAEDTGAAVILCHHIGKTGEEHSSNAKYGRGASALLAAMDVGLTLRLRNPRTEEENDEDGSPHSSQRFDLVRVKIEKNRVGFDSGALYIEMEGNGWFRQISQLDYKQMGQAKGREAKKQGHQELARTLFLELAGDFKVHDGSEFFAKAKAKDIPEIVAKEVLDRLRDEGRFMKQNAAKGRHQYLLLTGNSSQFQESSTKDDVLVIETGSAA